MGINMKIMHIVRNIEYCGGAEEFVMRLITEQLKEHTVGLCCIEGIGDIAKTFEKKGVQLYDSPMNWTFPFGVKNIKDIVEKENYEIIHTHLFNADVAGAVLGRITDIPVISTKYCMFSRAIEKNTLLEKTFIKPFVDSALERVVSSGISEIHAVSSEVRDKWSKFTNVPVYVIPCAPRDIEYGATTVAPANEKLVLGSLSRLVPEKGIDLGIDIIKEVVKSAPITWKIAGDGYLNNQLQSKVKDLGLENSIHFLGKLDDTQKFLEDVDVYFHPSRSEGLPIAIQEAMFSRKPIIASNVGGMPDLVLPGFNGSLINPYNPISSSNEILKYINNADLIIKEGNNSRQYAESKFAFTKVYSDIINAYKRCLQS
jgi:L-malate glycosyltransferase